jgi:hypothetical protein
VVNARTNGFVHHQLQGWHIKDGQQFLWHSLCDGVKTGAKTGSGDNGGTGFHVFPN